MIEFEALINEGLKRPNYLIEGNGPYSVIYFTSLDVYKDNDVEDFKKRVLEKTLFEFYKTRIQKQAKHIFVKDINKAWYQKGINNDLNSSEKLLEFLKEETKGTKIITVGSSAGGSAAVYFGLLLGAQYVFAFNAQFVHGCFDTRNLIASNPEIPIFCVLSGNCEADVRQYQNIKDFKNIYTLALKTPHHGVAVAKNILLRILNSDLKKLKKMYSHKAPVSEKVFVLKHFGLLEFFKRIMIKNSKRQKTLKIFCNKSQTRL